MREALAEVRAAGGDYSDLVRTRRERSRAVSKAITLYYGGYRVNDGAIILRALTPANRHQMWRALGIDDDPSASPDFNALDPAMDVALEALAERIRGIMLTRTMDEWIEAFDQEGAPVSKVNFPEDMANDPQVEAMGFLIDLDHEMSGPERLVGPVVSARTHKTGSPRPSPILGAHNAEILAEVGADPELVAQLQGSSVA
jgi:crotonobetainyl-CoA:carnitine CoA-transferase CaiB-like acyl-CoA transferase